MNQQNGDFACPWHNEEDEGVGAAEVATEADPWGIDYSKDVPDGPLPPSETDELKVALRSEHQGLSHFDRVQRENQLRMKSEEGNGQAARLLAVLEAE